jgi:hypothetical protein
MFKLMGRMSLVALAAVASMYGCTGDTSTPSAPSALPANLKLADVPVCGEVAYLSELSPVFPVWRDSLESWASGADLNPTPAWADASVASYLAQLVPTLQQWAGAVNTALGSEVLASVDSFDAGSTTTQAYLVYLSGLLLGWESSAEAARELDFLLTPPTFAPDEFPPVLECPADTSFTCADTDSVVLKFEAIVMDDCDEAPVVVCDPPSGSFFHSGTTTVSCTATDASGNSSTCSFDVTVESAEVDIDAIVPSPSVLWPPNHKMFEISFGPDTENACGLELTCTVLEVMSNEPINGLGDGNTEPDWMVGEDGVLQLRAERSGTGDGRVYMVRLHCENVDLGIDEETTVEVVVPHDQGEE